MGVWRMTALVNFIGRVFGRLTVIDRAPTRNRQTMWLCVCQCGTRKDIDGRHLRKGNVVSCGCRMREAALESITKHGYTKTHRAEYKIWGGIKQRCLNPNSTFYHRYGGRGITICAEWRDDFAAFLEHVGPRPSPDMSIDRIDNDRGYEPGNVRWATQTQQVRNRDTRSLSKPRDEYGGLSIRQLAEATGKTMQHIRYRRWKEKKQAAGRAA